MRNRVVSINRAGAVTPAERKNMKYTLYNNEGNEVMKANNDMELADLINWIYEHDEGFILDENNNTVEC